MARPRESRRSVLGSPALPRRFTVALPHKEQPARVEIEISKEMQVGKQDALTTLVLAL